MVYINENLIIDFMLFENL